MDEAEVREQALHDERMDRQKAAETARAALETRVAELELKLAELRAAAREATGWPIVSAPAQRLLKLAQEPTT